MSDPIDGTLDQTPEEVWRILSALRPVFAAGEAVPGLSSWVLQRKLGVGGFGEVWLAKHAWNAKEQPRAVKFCTDPEAKNRLVSHEQNVVRRVMKYAGDHPNIVPLLDCNLDGDIPWLMYEFVEGGTLADAMTKWRGFPLPKRLGRTVRVLHAIASALAACHRLDPPLVHRDMKPHNVLMAGSVPRITDFGIGSVVARPKTDSATAELTAQAARLPTGLQHHRSFLWSSPEREFGSPPDPLDDVYALGVIAYQLIVGDLSLGPGPDAVLNLRERNVPGEFVTLIINSVALDPHRRPKDATEWESRLAALLQKAQKQRGPTDAPLAGSRPVLLPEPDGAGGPDEPPRFGDNDFEVPTPEPTAGLPVRTGLLQFPPALPAAVELPTEPPPFTTPLHDNRKSTQPTSPGRRYVAITVGSTLILALVVVVSLLPSGTRSAPSPRSVKNDPKGDTNNPKSDGSKSQGGGPQAPKKEPEPKVLLPKAGDTCEIEIAPSVKMTFCWIPEGECQLGSPKDEQDYVAKTFYKGKRPDYLGTESEATRATFKTDGFWLGRYTVTQAEWKAVMGDNPSYFDGTKENKAKGMDTLRFPVETVSWDRICGAGKYAGEGFLNKIDDGGIQVALGKPGKFRLPESDQWEYAARVGRGNEQPFYWGTELNGTQANCDGTSPYGGLPKGTNLGRTCAVDSTDDEMGHKYAPHPWGLMHMHGNVYQWCENFYDKSNTRRILRGGSWGFIAHYCRAAYRDDHAPDYANDDVGFRLVVSGRP